MRLTRDVIYMGAAVPGQGGGGSDPHNLGWYATQSALETAHPTAEDGDWAIVGTTDTVWVWDSDTNAWKDTDQKGQVTSVNGQTGDVTVQATLVNQSNIKSVNGNSLLGSGNLELSTYLPYPAGWTTTGTTKAFCDDIAADTSAVAGKAYLGEVTCSDLPASMANAEIVVEIMAGTTANNKVIVLTCTSGNTAPYMWKYTYWNNGTDVSGWKGFQEQLVSGTNIKTINGASVLGTGDLTVGGLPDQTGQSGKFLTTDGTDASWGVALANIASLPQYSIRVGSYSGTLSGTGQVYLGIDITGNNGTNSTVIGCKAKDSSSQGTVVIGYEAQSGTLSNYGIAIGNEAKTGTNARSSIAIGRLTATGAQNAIQLGGASGGSTTVYTNSDANTFKVGNANGNFEMMNANGNLPVERLASTTGLADGNYKLRLTISGGVATLSWVAE